MAISYQSTELSPPINNNYRDGYMQPQLFVGNSTSTPNDIGGVAEPGVNATLAYSGSSGENAGAGPIGRYTSMYDWFGQARTFWSTLDVYAQQHTVDAYRFELGNVPTASTVQNYIDTILKNVDNCLARRVAYGVGANMPAAGSGPVTNMTNATSPYPSLYPLTMGIEPNKSNVGLSVAVLANDTLLSQADVDAMTSLLTDQGVTLTVVGPRVGPLQSGINASASYITTSSVFYDAIFIGSTSNPSNGTTALTLDPNAMAFVMEAYSHGKAIGALGDSGAGFLTGLGVRVNQTAGLYAGAAGTITVNVLDALSGPVRFPWRFPTDDVATICGGG